MGSDGPKDPPGQRTLQLWSKPLEPADGAQGSPDGAPGSPDEAPGSPGGAGAAPPAGSRLWQAIAMIKPEDILTIPYLPCVRQGLLPGIASGCCVGALKFIIQGNLTRATQWAYGTFLGGSIVCYEYCQFQRRQERAKMKRCVEVVAAKRKNAREAAEENKRLAEESRETEARHEQLRPEQKRKPWYKPW